MKFDLSEKKAVVTGGSSGIGKAIAETLDEKGAEVFIVDLNENPSHKKKGIHTILADITQGDELNKSLAYLPKTRHTTLYLLFQQFPSLIYYGMQL